MKINALDKTGSQDQYHSSEYIIAIESHLTYLRASGLKSLVVTKQQTYKYEGDFYGLLNELLIPKYYHYVIMRVNDLVNSANYSTQSEIIYMPDLELVDRIVTLIETKNN